LYVDPDFNGVRRQMTRLLLILLFYMTTPAWAQSRAAEISFLAQFSSQIAHRPLNATEISQINAQGSAAYPAIVRTWFREPQFIESAQVYVDNRLRTSGTTATVDMNLPGNLGRDIARRERPYADLVTANTCVNAAGQNMSCDSNAPFSAGVLTTK